MKRLTDSKVAENLRHNIAGLSAAGIEPLIDDLRYIKLAAFEDDEERKEKLFVAYDPDEYYE